MKILREADAREPRLQRSIEKALSDFRKKLALSEVTTLIQLGEKDRAVDAAMKTFDETLGPTRTIVRDSFMRGTTLSEE